MSYLQITFFWEVERGLVPSLISRLYFQIKQYPVDKFQKEVLSLPPSQIFSLYATQVRGLAFRGISGAMQDKKKSQL